MILLRKVMITIYANVQILFQCKIKVKWQEPLVTKNPDIFITYLLNKQTKAYRGLLQPHCNPLKYRIFIILTLVLFFYDSHVKTLCPMAKQRHLAAIKQELLKNFLKDAYAEDLSIFEISI